MAKALRVEEFDRVTLRMSSLEDVEEFGIASERLLARVHAWMDSPEGAAAAWAEEDKEAEAARAAEARGGGGVGAKKKNKKKRKKRKKKKGGPPRRAGGKAARARAGGVTFFARRNFILSTAALLSLSLFSLSLQHVVAVTPRCHAVSKTRTVG